MTQSKLLGPLAAISVLSTISAGCGASGVDGLYNGQEKFTVSCPGVEPTISTIDRHLEVMMSGQDRMFLGWDPCSVVHAQVTSKTSDGENASLQQITCQPVVSKGQTIQFEWSSGDIEFKSASMTYTLVGGGRVTNPDGSSVVCVIQANGTLAKTT